MKINVKKLAEALALVIAEAIGATTEGDAADDNDTGAAPTKRGRGRPAGSTSKKATKKASSKTKDEDDDDDGLGDDDDDGLGDDEDDGLGLEDEEEVTQEELVAAFKALKSSKGVEKCREVLAKIDESNVLNIPPKKYGEAMKEINRAGSKK